MRKLRTVVAYLAKNGVQFIELSKKDIQLLDRSTQKVIRAILASKAKSRKGKRRG